MTHFSSDSPGYLGTILVRIVRSAVEVDSLYCDSAFHAAYSITISSREAADHPCLPFQRRVNRLGRCQLVHHECQALD